MRNFLAILFIAWKALLEEHFFIQESQDDHDKHSKGKGQSPP